MQEQMALVLYIVAQYLCYDFSICSFTTVEVDSSNEFQVGVDSSDTVDIPTVLESRTDRCLVQVLGLALKPCE